MVRFVAKHGCSNVGCAVRTNRRTQSDTFEGKESACRRGLAEHLAKSARHLPYIYKEHPLFVGCSVCTEHCDVHIYDTEPTPMTNKTIKLSDELYQYLVSVSLRESDALRRLREATAALPQAGMQIAPEQAQFMALLVELLGVRNALEIGVFTGYSALAVAAALPSDGRLIACDISVEWTTIAQQHWAAAGLAEKIDLRLAPALETLDDLLRAGQANHFDFAFIDADKSGYLGYYERCLALVRPGGLIMVDNVLWSGKVCDPSVFDPDTEALRVFNNALHEDTRITLSMIPVADGITLARKRGRFSPN
jgi:predicted O-methyltransferase YrrM